MKMILVAAIAALSLAAVSAGAQTGQIPATVRRAPAVHPPGADLETTILELERQRIAAMVGKDIARLDALLADDMSYTHSGGTTDTKTSFLTLIRERGRYLGVDYSDTQVVPWGGNTVVVRGRAEIRLENTPGYGVLFMDVWALRNGSWKMVAWQATRIPAPATK